MDPATMAIMQQILTGGKRMAGGFTGNVGSVLGGAASAFGQGVAGPGVAGPGAFGQGVAGPGAALPFASGMQSLAPSQWTNEVAFNVGGGARRPPLSVLARGGR